MSVRGVHRTIRFRITAVAVLAVAVVLITTGVALVLVQRNQLNSNVDQTLEQRLEILESEIRASGVPDELAGAGDDDRFTEISVEGALVASTTRPDDDPYRSASITFSTPDGEVEVVVGEATDDIDDSVNVLRTSLAVAIPLVLAVVAALVWWLVGRTLQPVESIRSEVAAIGAGQLDRRVTEPETGDEIAALSHTMNEMLERIDESVRRQQRFAADASHELRSPLTRIRTQLEVDAGNPATADLGATHESVLEETVALQNMVDDLLYLARTDSAGGVRRDETVDLDDVVTEEAQRLRTEAAVVVDTSELSGAAVRGDRAALRRAVRNLLDNASRHASSTVSVQLRELEGDAELTIDDDGPGIPETEREHIFERFARLDAARSADTGGTGLGLAITSEIVADHGGSIRVEDSPGGGARFVVTLPAA